MKEFDFKRKKELLKDGKGNFGVWLSMVSILQTFR